MNTNQSAARRVALLGIFFAIIILQTYIPILGYIPIPPLNPTTIHVTVIVAGIILGPRDGLIVGFFWGLLRWINVFIRPQTPLDPIIWVNPLITILPRMLVGLVAGYVYRWLNRTGEHFNRAAATAGVAGSLTNTVLVLSLIFIFYGEVYAAFIGVDYSSLLWVLLGVVFTNGLFEAIIAAVLSIIIARPLKKLNKL